MENIAIIVGNSMYENSTDLGCCLADVDAISTLLHATGKYGSIEVLANESAAVLKDRIRQLLGSVSPVDELFFYFSGHGYQNNGEFYFNATDFDSSRPNETGLSYGELHTLVKATDTELAVFVIDACCSGTLLLKSDGEFLPEPKDGIRSLLKIASCLEDQSSLAGDPLSLFTENFYAAALSKESGTVYYSDIINNLRDRFLINQSQCPHFVVQGTAREIFVDSAAKLKHLRALRNEQLEAKLDSENSDRQSDEPPLSILDQIRAIDERYTDKETAQQFISDFFADIVSAFSVTSPFDEIFDCEYEESDDFKDEISRPFISRTLAKENRIDRFVTAETDRDVSSSPFGNFAFSSAIWGSNDDKIRHVLSLNCEMDKVQLRLTLTPKYQCLNRLVLVISCAPSLDACYVFEVLTSHALRDWGSYEPLGKEVNRRWYKLAWDDDTDDVVEMFCEFLNKTVDTHINVLVTQSVLANDE